MGIEVYWLNERQTVIVNQVVGFWSLDDFWTSFEQTQRLMGSVHHEVHLILDMEKSQGLPPGFIPSLKNIRTKAHPNTGMTVLVGANPLVVAFSKMFTRLFPVKEARFVMVATISDAFNELRRRGADRAAKTNEHDDSDSEHV